MATRILALLILSPALRREPATCRHDIMSTEPNLVISKTALYSIKR